MEQYKVILVDDEVEVIDVMKKKIRWNVVINYSCNSSG